MNAAAVARVKQQLLANPLRIDARSAALRVLGERYKCTPAAAKAKLEETRGCHSLNELFRRVMPAEYDRELKKARGSRVDAGRRFFACLGFPVYEDIVLEHLAGSEDPFAWGYSGIPIPCLSVHLCPDCLNFPAIPLAYQLAFLVARSRNSDLDLETSQLLDDQDGEYWRHVATKYDLPERLRPCGVIDIELLMANFTALKTPLRFVVDVMQTITYSTGSVFMDFNDEEGTPGIDWSAGNVAQLREDYKIALKVEANVNKLDGWLREEPAPKVAQALRVYAKTRKQSDEKWKRSRVRVGADEGRELVRIL